MTGGGTTQRDGRPPAGASIGSREALALVAIVALAALLRFTGLGDQSFWLDEAFTVLVVDGSLGETIDQVAESESTPPLYYLLAWAWAQLAGTGEAGLRSLSALLGTATVPVAYLAARRLVSSPAALVLAALVATNPFLVWYSQEARAYALVVLLGALSLLLAARAADDGSRRSLVLWALAAAGVVASHYFAAFLVAAEAAWLLSAPRTARPARVAVAALAAFGAALAPLALDQRDNQGASGFDEAALSGRLADVPREFLLGEYGGPVRGLGPLCAALAAVALVLLIARGAPGERRRALVPAAIGAGTILLALAAALVGADYLTPRHLAPAWVPLFAAVAAGMATQRARIPGLLAAVALAAAFAAVSVAIKSDEELQRDDWRSAAASIGERDGPRVILMSPDTGFVPLSLYEPGTAAPPAGSFEVGEIAVIAMTRSDGPRLPPGPPLPGFRPLRVELHASYAAARYAADPPRAVSVGPLAATRLTAAPTGVVYQP